MDLKGGFAYIDIKGSVIETNISSENSVYVEGLYKSVITAIKSRKLIVLYNCGGNLQNVPILAIGYNIMTTSGTAIMRVTVITSSGGISYKLIYIKTDSTYYVTV